MSDQPKTKIRTAPPRQYGLRLPGDISTQLQAIAKAENNSVSSVMRRLITKALATAPDHEAA